MANHVIAQVLGGPKQVIEGASTVGDVRRQLNLENEYQAMVSGSSKSDSDSLRDGDYVAFTRKVKGGTV